MKRIFTASLILLFSCISSAQNRISDFVLCQDHDKGYSMFFDLNEKNNEILNGRNASGFSISYHHSKADAEAKSNKITQNLEVQSTADKTIFYRLEDKSDPSLFEIGSFTLKVIRTEVRMDEDFYCGNSEGYYQFKLSNLDNGMLNHQYPPDDQDPAIHEVSYYLTEEDAENQVNLLDKNSWTNTISDEQMIYVRVQRTDEYSCYHVKFFVIYIARTLEDIRASNESICTQEDPSAINYDFTNKDQEILNGADPSQFNILYFNSEADALNRNSEITQINGSQFPKKIWFRVEDNMFRECFETGSFNLEIEKGIEAKEPAPIIVCDIAETGKYSINLSEKDIEILNGENPADYNISYFPSQADAQNSSNEIPKQNYEVSLGNTTLYAKLSPKDGRCSSIANLQITLSALPQPTLEESYFLCEESSVLMLDGGDFESWEWLDNNYSMIGNERSISINEPGEYGLAVTKTNNGNTCQNIAFFTVNLSEGIGEINHTVNGPENDLRLEIEPQNSGNYEYSIDGVNFQASSEFKVGPGTYEITVRDIGGCAMATSRITVQGYQKYFTPNGDGINDEWKIVATENGVFLDVLIYDRYGKLLAQILSGKGGWDGTYNGKPMPSNDYWFSIEYPTGNLVTGHFSLVRK